VSFLELFYDLVYVVLIGQVAHHLAGNVDWSGLLDFAVVFGLIWYAWLNGTLWHELHSREDGRSRNYIFMQMGLLALLAVFAGEATGDRGPSFATVYAVLFVLFTWQWFLVHRIDDVRYRQTTTRYLAGMISTVAVVVASAFVGREARLWMWGVVVVVWSVWGFRLVAFDRTAGFGEGFTASLIERFGLFTIIVLGEVVVGVVQGISDTEELTPITIATGVGALTIGYGLWWNYFDALGRRVPGQQGPRLAGWLSAHLPLAMAIAAGGAAMVSLVEHAADSRSPVGSSWLLAGSVSVALLGIAIASRALPADAFPNGMSEQILPTYGVAIVAILFIGAMRPAPIILVVTTSLLLALTWLRLFVLLLAKGGVPGAPAEGAVDAG